MKTRFHFRALGLAAGLVWALLPAARAQEIALSVGNMVPVTNALGRHLPGTWGDADNSCRVEIRQTWTDGVILAPSNGSAQVDAYNPLITNSYLGFGVVGSNPGMYSETFTNSSTLATNQTYYVRVFDRPNPAAAIYYADTLPFNGPPEHVGSINPEFGNLRLTSGAEDVDTDGDGIPDAMEDDMGTSSSQWDTDGDGFDDYFEATHDQLLSPTEPDLDLRILAPAFAGDAHRVDWGAKEGVNYRLEYTDVLPFEELYTVPFWSGTATNSRPTIDVESVVTNDEPIQGFFRVFAVP